jgi:spore maturation protein CgeB
VLQEASGVRGFYDIDTPVTLSHLRSAGCEYLRAEQIPGFELLLSFTGGPTLQVLEERYGAQCARALYCSVDVDQYRPLAMRRDIALGYMGTYSEDRQPGLEQLLNEPARQHPEQAFMVVGAQYPATLQWPANVQQIAHLPPSEHPGFYSRQHCTLNLTRADMRAAGYSPSVRLFEAGACATPIISDEWQGMHEVLEPGREILVARNARDIAEYLSLGTEELRRIAAAARQRVLDEHCSACRATQLQNYIEEAQTSGAAQSLDIRGRVVANAGAVS